MNDLLKRLVVFILTGEARLVLARYKPKVIAVTGSVGKTTTKDAIFACLSGRVHVRKSEKSLNSRIGTPLSILGCENGWNNPFKWGWNILKGLGLIVIARDYPAWLVLEVGADRPGDIRAVAKWLRPTIAVLTGVPEIPAHVEYFESAEAVAREKRTLAQYLRPGGGLIMNGDDARMEEARSIFRGTSETYGFGAQNDFSVFHEEIIYEAGAPTGIRFHAGHKGSSVPVSIHGALGRPRIYAALAALAVAEAVGIDLSAAAHSLGEWPAPPGRLRLLRGKNGSTIIDDTYNSSPAAALEALDVLRDVQGCTRRIAVLGDMLELGKYSAEAHRQVGARAAQCADMLITVGFRARVVAEAALDAGMPESNILQYEQNESTRAGGELAQQAREGDLVLVKGSQSMRMERTVFEIMAEPERAPELLVRQDPEWKNR